jgi:hypothetical protein
MRQPTSCVCYEAKVKYFAAQGFIALSEEMETTPKLSEEHGGIQWAG